MKKYIMLLLLMVLFIGIRAQEVGSMKFMGISMNQSIKEFSSQLSKKGFKLTTKFDKRIDNPQCRVFLGTWGEFSDAMLLVNFLRGSGMVYRANLVLEKSGLLGYGRYGRYVLLMHKLEKIINKRMNCIGVDVSNEKSIVKKFIMQDSISGKKIGSIFMEYDERSITLTYYDIVNYEKSQNDF